jgi:hypothetical protein
MILSTRAGEIRGLRQDIDKIIKAIRQQAERAEES